jgi:hypothetical protein
MFYHNLLCYYDSVNRKIQFLYGEDGMFRVFVLLLLLLAPLEALAAPAIVVDGLRHDFGEILQGEKLDHIYRFQNSGDEILMLSDVRSSCGCTAAILSQDRLEPGAVGELRVIFDSDGFKGSIHKSISLNTNDPEHPTVVFGLQGSVSVQLFAEPSKINWGRVAAGAALQSELKIVNKSKQTIRLKEPKSTVAGVLAVLSKKVLEPGDEAVVSVTGEYPQDKKRLAGYLIIETDFSPVSQLRLPVSARLK